MDIVGSHQRVLLGAALRTTGTILELGVGWYSTPLLHEIAEVMKRKVITYDNIDYWLEQFMTLNSKHHKLELVGWWGDMPLEERYGLVFVDQGQPAEREYAIRRLFLRTDVFVMHDTEETEQFAYGYQRILPMFKYQWTDTCQKAWTTVASNTIDVTKWFTALPPVEPEKPKERHT